MKEKVPPLIITTKETFENALSHDYPVLYIEKALCQQLSGGFCSVLARHGYSPHGIVGKQGIFFPKLTGKNRFDPQTQTIYDPLDIL